MISAVNNDSRVRRACMRAGFSLMEIMIAVMILGLVAGLVAPRVLQFLENSRVSAAKAALKTFKNAIDMYRLDIHQLPTKLKDLIKKPAGEAAKRWKHSYLDKEEEPEDPWGNKYSYKVTPGGKHPYELLSYGSDEGKSTPKDKWISVWDEN